MNASTEKIGVDTSIAPQARMRRYLQLIATGPELSKSLTEAQAEDAMDMILKGQISPVRTALFLIALRMKRETDAENIGVLNALMRNLRTCTARSPEILAVADPFNGYTRSLPVTPFLPAVYAACGLPTYIHGLKFVGPKYGITARMALDAAGVQVELSPSGAAQKLDHVDTGWCYLDQGQYIPALNKLVELRDEMVKRSCISTLEVVLQPLRGARATYLVTGFVHKAYPPVYAMLARHAGFDSSAIVRGVEGGCIPSLSQVSRYFGCWGSEELTLNKLAPGEFGIERKQRAIPIPEAFQADIEQTSCDNTRILKGVVEHTVELGLEALGNTPGRMRDSLIYGAAIGLRQFRLASGSREAAAMATRAIASGEALARFRAACC